MMSLTLRLKRIVKRLVEIRRGEFGVNAQRNRFADMKLLLNKPEPLIVDGGANQGITVASFLKHFPGCAVHAFEPVPFLAELLRKRYPNTNGVVVHQKALGSENGKARFKVMDYHSASSFLEPTTTAKSYHKTEYNNYSETEVEMTRLDNCFTSAPFPDILKLDLQGYELEALKGCGALLRNLRIIATEIEFVPLYEKQPLFGDIDRFLRENGFFLFNFYELWTLGDGQIETGDAIFLNRDYFTFPPKGAFGRA
jgi:FkbM family methyltransferase